MFLCILIIVHMSNYLQKLLFAHFHITPKPYLSEG